MKAKALVEQRRRASLSTSLATLYRVKGDYGEAIPPAGASWVVSSGVSSTVGVRRTIAGSMAGGIVPG